MIEFLKIFAYISSGIALATSAIFGVGMAFVAKSKNANQFKSEKGLTPRAFGVCAPQIQICRVSSVIFLVLYWISASTGSLAEYQRVCDEISKICEKLNVAWFIFAFFCVILGLLTGILDKSERKREENNKNPPSKSLETPLSVLNQLRTSAFIMGAVYLIIAIFLGGV